MPPTKLLSCACLSVFVCGFAFAGASKGLPLPITAQEKRVVYKAMSLNHATELDRLIGHTKSFISVFGSNMSLYERANGRWVDTGSTADHLAHMLAARGETTPIPAPSISLPLNRDRGIQVAGYRTLDRGHLRGLHDETMKFLELYPEAGLGGPGEDPVPVRDLASSMGEALRLPQLTLAGAGMQMLAHDPLIFHRTLFRMAGQLWGGR